jgi:type I restriction enzyme M protein
MHTKRLEASTTQAILIQLENLGWEVDEHTSDCTVFQQRAKTEGQKAKLRGKKPDFVLYQAGTNIPIAIIEAKKSDQSLTQALNQAEEFYAKPTRSSSDFCLQRHLCCD